MRSEVDLRRASLAVKAVAVKLGIHRELELDSVLTVPYTEDEILRIENFAEELATEKITGQLYTMGVPYEDARIKSSVYAMATEPIAYSLLALDKLRKRADEKTVKTVRLNADTKNLFFVNQRKRDFLSARMQNVVASFTGRGKPRQIRCYAVAVFPSRPVCR